MNLSEDFNFTVASPTNWSSAGNDTGKFILPVWRQALWSALYATIIVIATGGNVIVIWIVLAHKRMRTVTNYFLLNLSVADTMVSTLNVTFSFVYCLNGHWPFGELYCKISQFISVVSVCASVFSLMAISIDRYMAIMTPLRPRMGKTATLCVTVGIWTVSAIFSVPNLFVYVVFHDVEGERDICYPDWENGLHQKIYEILFLFVTYLVPIGSMTFAYARIGKELWGSQSIGECTQRQRENIRNKRRVVKMMMIVVIIFAVCWLPYDLYFIIVSFYPNVQDVPYIQETYLAIYWLAMSNSMYNPIIYCWLNSRFRRGFKQVFSWLPYVTVSPARLTRRGVFTSNRRSYSGSPDHNRIVRNGTVRVPMYNACQNQSSDTCYTNVDDFGSARGSRRWRANAELRQAPSSATGAS